MSFDVDRIRKSTDRVVRFLRKNAKDPSSDAVHDLRTSARSLETTIVTLGLDSRRKAAHLLTDLADIRKSAGKVREMDVLTAAALTLKIAGERDCLVQLLEHLGAERRRFAKKLHVKVKKTDSRLTKSLKQSLKRLEELVREAKDSPEDSDAIAATIAKAMQVASELRSPRRLNRTNLHPYRLKVKELRNLLQLSDHAGDQALVEKLGEVKDAIGEWHDWEELCQITAEILQHGPACKLLKQLKSTTNSKLKQALSLTEHLRSHHLRSGRKRGSRPSHVEPPSIAVLETTSAATESESMGQRGN